MWVLYYTELLIMHLPITSLCQIIIEWQTRTSTRNRWPELKRVTFSKIRHKKSMAVSNAYLISTTKYIRLKSLTHNADNHLSFLDNEHGADNINWYKYSPFVTFSAECRYSWQKSNESPWVFHFVLSPELSLRSLNSCALCVDKHHSVHTLAQ